MLLLASTLALGCTRSGEVVVVVDSTMRGDSVEVVAVRTDSTEATTVPPAAKASEPPGPEADRLAVLDDSVSALDARFRRMRDSLNHEVSALDSLDRRTRPYSVRYAEIRRRTIVAEQLRAARDSLGARAEALRSGLGAAGVASSSTPGSELKVSAPADAAAIQRRPIAGSTVTLRLPAGRWAIGTAPRGTMPLQRSTVAIMVARGSADTLRLSMRGLVSPNRP